MVQQPLLEPIIFKVRTGFTYIKNRFLILRHTECTPRYHLHKHRQCVLSCTWEDWEKGAGLELVPAGLLYQKHGGLKTFPCQLRGTYCTRRGAEKPRRTAIGCIRQPLHCVFTTLAMWSKSGIDLSICSSASDSFMKHSVAAPDEGHLQRLAQLARGKTRIKQ